MNHLPTKRTLPQSVTNTVTGLAGEGVIGGRSAEEHTRVPPKAVRLFGLDLAKGVLVLIMVIYHWMNYFIGLDSALYKYLRFLTPSFIFVTGFLISHVYLGRFAAGEGRIPARLVRRGLKLMGIVLFLNVAARILGTGIAATRMGGVSFRDLAWAYLTGSAPVAFSVLVPISYLLILSAGLLIMSRHFRGLFHLVSAVLIAGALICEWKGFQSGYLDMLSIGMLGVTAGHIPISAITRVIQHRVVVLICYAAYLVAVTTWNAVYALQIVGVCVNLAIFYWLESGVFKDRILGRALIRLGEYSLFAYIAQIVILQVIRRGAHALDLGMDGAYVALLVGAGCTMLSVEVVEYGRHRVAALNRAYTSVFS